MNADSQGREAQPPLAKKRIAALVTDGFERSELIEPRDALQAAGASVDVIAPNSQPVRSWSGTQWGESVPVTTALEGADSKSYDALLLPGGVQNSDTLRLSRKAIEFVRHFVASGKAVGALCHAPWLLIEAEAVEGVALTSCPSLRTDLLNAGALWLDQAVVADRGIVTSRRPDDIPAFIGKLIEEISDGATGGEARAA